MPLMNVNDPQNSSVFQEWMENRKQEIEHTLEQLLPPPDTRPAVVHKAMRYACLNGGKRLRGILTLGFCECLGSPARRAMKPAAALEIFHASTLIHDDLPCMDDDDLRRGQPATHIQFGEANALLAGNALLTLALGWMGETAVPLPHPPCMLVSELARAGGSEGVIGGQIEDLEAETTPADEEKVMYIHTEKTARLIACACRCGAICGGGCASKVERAGSYGMNLGMAFQILDDILDCTQSTEKLGKPAKSDEGHGKMTSVSLWGLEGARAKAADYTQKALEDLESLEGPTDMLEALTRWLLEREM
ncbi:polyprenyl synthetase family protein [Kiritimatiellota bacterium B12222]|nr:polyprenyl synthetase family protein [Kiritimatiellota bacterium B12222]